jgi:hypothetical protein
MAKMPFITFLCYLSLKFGSMGDIVYFCSRIFGIFLGEMFLIVTRKTLLMSAQFLSGATCKAQLKPAGDVDFNIIHTLGFSFWKKFFGF